MEAITFAYFPRLHTAIAEWLACLVILYPLKKRYSSFASGVFLLLSLVLLIGVNLPAEGESGFLWFTLIILAMLIMYATIRVVSRTGHTRAMYCWAIAFMFSEVAGSLEWQICFWLVRQGAFTAMWQVHLFMVFVFLLLYAVWFVSVRHLTTREKESVTRSVVMPQQAFASMLISIGTFLISNVSFAFPESTLLGTLNEGALHVRTVVDIGGICMLYAFEVQRRSLSIAKELHATESILNRQYEQYQQFEANNEVLHRVYHDLKHQIAYLEDEKDADKRRTALADMKETIRCHEARISTGNSVLDTLLTGKSLICVDEDIIMTCYANAEGIDFIDTMDLCAILGNALDNAIEYERTVDDLDSRIIRVFVRREGAFQVIRVENYCDQELNFRNGLPTTTKQNKAIHGYGLKSIQLSVQKYNGALEVKQEDDWFTVTAMIPMTET